MVRAWNPRTVLVEEIADLIHRAMKRSEVAGPGWFEEVAQRIGDPRFGLFLGFQDGAWKGLAMATWSSSAIAPVCSVTQFYNRGTVALRNALVDAVVDFAREGGFERILTLDTNRRPVAFKRAFRRAGRAKQLGQGYLFTLPEVENGR